MAAPGSPGITFDEALFPARTAMGALLPTLATVRDETHSMPTDSLLTLLVD
ncbi:MULTISPECIES: hypothetical protein [unclassified Geodermatophilus]|uniref:hypothetical protein n=1 Tax=unclassified Geodermatophilus TaxID=2637632 RepID=UPI003EEDB701